MKTFPVYKHGAVVGQAIVDDDVFAEVSQFRWTQHTKGYVHRAPSKTVVSPSGRRKRTCTSIYLHRLVMKAAPGDHIDHLDGNKFDNRRSNLEAVSIRENTRRQNARLGGVCVPGPGVANDKHSPDFATSSNPDSPF